MDNKEKVLNYSIIAVLIVFVLIMIGIIWSPTLKKMSKDGINSYNTYTYASKIDNYYSNYLKENLKITNFTNLYKSIDSDYLKGLNIEDEETAKEYLKNNDLISMSFVIGNVDVYEGSKNNVIVVEYYVNDVAKYALIKETAPYHFSISFSADSNFGKGIIPLKEEAEISLVNYKVTILESNRDTLRLKIDIQNNSSNIIKYDASYLDSIQLVYSNSKTMNMSATANSSSTVYEITPGSSRSVEGVFKMNFGDQLKINKIKLNNFEINNSKVNVEI